MVLQILLHAAADNVEQFGGNGLLARLVVRQGQFAQEFIGVVGCNLHGNHAGGVLAGKAVQKRGVEL